MGGTLPALIGRERETVALADAVERAASGALSVCLLEGEAGSGKTRLLDVAVDEAHSRGFRVLRGAGHELSRDRPFGPLVDALGLKLADLAAVGGAETPIPLPGAWTPDLRYRAVESLIERVEGLTTSAPVALALDDLQWADEATFVALGRITAELTYAPLAVVAAARPLPRPGDLEILVQDLERVGGRRLELHPLGPEQLAGLAEGVLGGPPGPNLRGLLSRAGGNPFIAHEVLAAAREEGLVEVGGCLDVRGAEIPQAVRLVILQRLSRLRQEVRELLRQASILGTSFSPADLSAFLDRPATELTPLLEEAIRSGELVPDGSRVSFRHDIVREAVYGDTPGAVRQALHLQAARALAEAGALPLAVAPHFSLGASPGDSEAVEWLRRAAREALSSDPSAAATLLERVLELAPAPVALPEIRRELVSAYLWSRRPEEAITLGEELLDSGPVDPLTEARVRVALGTAFVAQARWEQAKQQFDAVPDESLPDPDRALVLAQRGHMRLPTGDVASAAAFAEEARRLAAGHPSLGLVVALHVQILVADATAQWSGIPELVTQAERAQDGDPTGEARLWPFRQLGVLLCRADRIDHAAEVLRRGLELAEATGQSLTLHTILSALAWRNMYAGDLEEATTLAETAIRVSAETDTRSALVLSLALLARAGVHRGEVDRAEEALQHLVRLMEDDPLQFQGHMGMWARGLLEEARGDLPAAHAALSAATDMMVAVGMPGEVREMGPDAARVALAAGDRDQALKVTETLEALAAREPLASVRASALQCRGLSEGDPMALTEAVEAWRDAGWKLHLARAQEDAAVVLASARRDDARSMLEEALRTYEAAGAVRDAARCDRALRDLGVRKGATGPRRRPSTGWEALTEAERRVVELAAEGLTNPQIAERLFLSRHTVKTHLTHAFQKLGMSSRLELVRALARGPG